MSTENKLPLVVLIDNYDSFVYNLYQYVLEETSNVVVFRNDAISIDALSKLEPGYIIISPGPKTPADAGLSKDIIDAFKNKCKILGVCLGHQCINEVFGGKTVHAPVPYHGKKSIIAHDGLSIYTGLPEMLYVGRYHSLMADPGCISDELKISSQTKDGIIMGLRHKFYSVEGVQFHPESFLTQHGKKMIQSFLCEKEMSIDSD